MVGAVKRKLVIFGTRQIAEVCAFYFQHDSEYEPVAFTVDGAYLNERTFMGRPVLAFEEVSRAFPPGECELFIAVSYQKMNSVRAEKYSTAQALGYRMATYVSSKAATWPGLSVGPNTFVMEANVIQPYANIGSDTILWSGNHIGHHARIGDHCFLASQIVVSGNVNVGDYCFVGVNATLHDSVTIAPRCLIGAGSLIASDTEPGQVYAPQATSPRRVPSSRVSP
jgi:sugar O-acyltransferase (sialic acid O-acetyltransferase NeuD family)